MCESCVVIKKQTNKKNGIFCKRPDKAEKGLMIEKTVIFSLLLSKKKSGNKLKFNPLQEGSSSQPL